MRLYKYRGDASVALMEIGVARTLVRHWCRIDDVNVYVVVGSMLYVVIV